MCSGSDPAVLQFTGGTTGTPKAAVLTHRNIVSNVMQVGCWHRALDSANPVVICILPFFHVFGMMICLNLAVVKGPQIMSGYWQNPELTARTIRDGWLYTGDLARMDADGFFYVVDRKDDLIISGGFNVYPSDVEGVLGRHPGIKDTAVIGVPDPIRGESILAFVVSEDGERPAKKEILAHCREYLASFKVPKAVIYVDSIPKSPVGKPLRKLLRRDHLGSKQSEV